MGGSGGAVQCGNILVAIATPVSGKTAPQAVVFKSILSDKMCVDIVWPRYGGNASVPKNSTLQ